MPEQQTRLLAERYELITPIGRGTMGTVWRSFDRTLGRDVAVKEIRQDPGLSDAQRLELRERMLREGRIAAKVSHPSVATVHDAIEVDGSPWIIMELVEGRSLEQVIEEEGPLPPRLVAEIGCDLLGALRAAHAQGILHRDVKPSNVLVTETGRVVLTDFGIAKAAGDQALTRTGMVIGSPGYTAPERARGDHTGPESDLWSLGATLYFAVEGRPAYERKTVAETLSALMTETADPPNQAGTLRPVLEGLLEKDHTRRIKADRAATLLRLVADTPVGTPLPAEPDLTTTEPPAPATKPAPRPAAVRPPGTPGVQPSGAPGVRPSEDRAASPAEEQTPRVNAAAPAVPGSQETDAEQTMVIIRPKGGLRLPGPPADAPTPLAAEAPAPESKQAPTPKSAPKPTPGSAPAAGAGAVPASGSASGSKATAGSASGYAQADTADLTALARAASLAATPPSAPPSAPPSVPTAGAAGAAGAVGGAAGGSGSRGGSGPVRADGPAGGRGEDTTVGGRLPGRGAAQAGSEPVRTVVDPAAGDETVSRRLPVDEAGAGGGLGTDLFAMQGAAARQEPAAEQGGRWRLVLLVGLVAMAFIAILALAVTAFGSGAAKKASGATGAQEASVSAEPSVVVSGLERHTGDNGFTIDRPGPLKPSPRGDDVTFRAPGDPRYLRVDLGKPAEDILKTAKTVAAKAPYAEYRELRLARVAPAPYAGTDVADWEFTYVSSGGTQMHALVRWVSVPGQSSYAIYWMVPQARWDEFTAQREAVLASFVPATPTGSGGS